MSWYEEYQQKYRINQRFNDIYYNEESDQIQEEQSQPRKKFISSDDPSIKSDQEQRSSDQDQFAQKNTQTYTKLQQTVSPFLKSEYSDKPSIKTQFKPFFTSLNKSKMRIPIVSQEEDPIEFERRFVQRSKDYHKTLVRSILQHERVKEEAGLKQQVKQQPIIDEKLNNFPLESEKIKLNEFETVEKLKLELKKQEEQICETLSDKNIQSPFLEHYKEQIKRSLNRNFLTFKCNKPQCPSIIKCSIETEGAVKIYLIRSKHNHTVTGQIMDRYNIKSRETIVIDEQLHQKFGLNKGVWGETRNLKYIPEEEKKIQDAEKRAIRRKDRKRLEQIIKTQKIKKQDNASFSSGDQFDKGVDFEKNYPRPSKKRKKHRMISRMNKQIKQMNQEFKNIDSELKVMKLKYLYFQDPQEKKFPYLIAFTSEQMIKLFKQSKQVVKFQISEVGITLDKRKYTDQNKWAMGIFSGLNCCQQPVVFCVCIIEQQKYCEQNLQKMFDCFFKLMGIWPNYFMTQQKKQIKSIIQKLKLSKRFDGKHIIDIENVFKDSKKYLQKQQNQSIINKMMNNFLQKDVVHYINKLKKYKQFKTVEYLQSKKQYIQLNEFKKDYLGFSFNMISSKEITQIIKPKMKLLFRYTLKYQVKKLNDFVLQINQNSQQKIHPEITIEVQKLTKDSHLEKVRLAVGAKTLNQFITEYGQSKGIQYKKGKFQNYVFKNKIMVKGCQCSCSFNMITKIPCRHLIKIMRQQKLDYLQSFHKKWKIYNEKQDIVNQKSISKGNQKK